MSNTRHAIFYSVGAIFGGIVCSIFGWAGMPAVVIGAAWTIFDEVRADRKREAAQ